MFQTLAHAFRPDYPSAVVRNNSPAAPISDIILYSANINFIISYKVIPIHRGLTNKYIFQVYAFYLLY